MPQTNHKKYMEIALSEAKSALAAHEFPVGCVIVADDKVVTAGRRENSQGSGLNEMDHAEIIALRDLIDNHPDIDPAGVTTYSTMEPCLMCFSTMILSGVRHIVYGFEDAMGGGTNLDLGKLNPLYQQMRINIVPHIMRAECLALFKEYFNDPANDYWRGSLLADYTLAQK